MAGIADIAAFNQILADEREAEAARQQQLQAAFQFMRANPEQAYQNMLDAGHSEEEAEAAFAQAQTDMPPGLFTTAVRGAAQPALRAGGGLLEGAAGLADQQGYGGLADLAASGAAGLRETAEGLPTYAPGVADIDSTRDAALFVSNAVGQVVGSVAPVMAATMAGGPAAGLGMAAGMLGGENIDAQATQLVEAELQRRGVTPEMPEYGQAVEAARRGVLAQLDLPAAGMAAAVQAPMEVAAPLKVLRGAPGWRGLTGRVAEVLQMMGLEAGTEVAQEVVTTMQAQPDLRARVERGDIAGAVQGAVERTGLADPAAVGGIGGLMLGTLEQALVGRRGRVQPSVPSLADDAAYDEDNAARVTAAEAGAAAAERIGATRLDDLPDAYADVPGAEPGRIEIGASAADTVTAQPMAGGSAQTAGIGEPTEAGLGALLPDWMREAEAQRRAEQERATREAEIEGLRRAIEAGQVPSLDPFEAGMLQREMQRRGADFQQPGAQDAALTPSGAPDVSFAEPGRDARRVAAEDMSRRERREMERAIEAAAEFGEPPRLRDERMARDLMRDTEPAAPDPTVRPPEGDVDTSFAEPGRDIPTVAAEQQLQTVEFTTPKVRRAAAEAGLTPTVFDGVEPSGKRGFTAADVRRIARERARAPAGPAPIPRAAGAGPAVAPPPPAPTSAAPAVTGPTGEFVGGAQVVERQPDLAGQQQIETRADAARLEGVYQTAEPAQPTEIPENADDLGLNWRTADVPLEALPSGSAVEMPRIEALREGGDAALADPIVLRRRADGGYELLDGRHRVAVARERGMTSLPAVIGEERAPARPASPDAAQVEAETSDGGDLPAPPSGVAAERDSAVAAGAPAFDQSMLEGGSLGSKQTRWFDETADMLGHFGLTERRMTVEQADEWVATSGRESGYEHTVALTPEGYVVGAGTNLSPTGVSLSRWAIDKARNNPEAGLVITHNHPINVTLSLSDLSNLIGLPGIGEMRAALPGGEVVAARRGPAADDRAMSRVPVALDVIISRQDLQPRAQLELSRADIDPDSELAYGIISRANARAFVDLGLIEMVGDPADMQLSQTETAIMERHRARIRDFLRGFLSGRTGRDEPAATGGAADGPANRAFDRSRPAEEAGARPAGGDTTGQDGPQEQAQADRRREPGAEAEEGLTDAQAREADDRGVFVPEPGQPGYDAPTTGSRPGRGLGTDFEGTAEGAARALPARGRLEGLPARDVGPNRRIAEAAEAYMRSAFGTDLARQSAYVPADPERGRRIADAFEAMPDDIDAPGVREAYERLAEEVEAQYQAAMDMGLEVSVITPDMPDPYPNGPRDVLRDLQRGHMWVYPTDMGFGTLNEANADSPMLRPTRFRVGDHVMLVNDLFRVVHDVFGHGREGVGFGPAGEENTWQSHVRMFSPQAARAMTTETRGQNSWVNYGPYGEQNRTNPRETVFADQKLGLLPEWASEIDVAGDADPVAMSVGRDVQEASWLGQRGVARLEPEQVARIVALAADRTGMRIGDTRAGQGGWFNPDAQQIELEPSTVTDVMPADDVALRRFASVLGYAAGQWSVLSVDASPRAGAFNSIVVRVTAPEAEGLFEDRIFELARDVAPDVFSGFAPVRGEGSTGAAMAVSMDDAAPERIDAAVEALARRLSDEGYEGVEVGAFPANADFHEGGADGGGYAAALRDIDGADPEPILRDVREAAGAIFEAGGSQDPVMQAVDVGKLRADLDLLSGRLRSENEAALAGRLREAVPALPDLAIRQLAAAGITPRDFRYVQRDPDGVHMEEQARWVWRELPSGEVLVISTRRREGRDVLDDAFVANAEERAKIGAPEREVATTGPRRRRRADTSDPLWSGRPARRNPAELNVGDMRPFRSIDVTQTDDFMRTPEQDVGLGPAVKRTIARVRSAQPEAMSASMRNLEQQLVNQFAPIRDLELRATGRETLLPGMDSAFKAAEIAMNDSGRVETLLHQGAAAYDEYGAFAPAKGTIGLIPMLQKLGDGQAVLDWMHYMAARRAQRLNGRGIKTPLSQADIAAGLAKETPLFREVAADWKAFNDANIDFAVDSGLVARKAADAMKRDDTYIPFYRVDERDPDDIDPAISGPAYRPARGINNPKSGIRAIKGGETLRLNNLIENMVMNSKTLVSGSMRNNAALKTADLLTMAGEGRVVSPARAPSGGLESGVLTLRRNGEEMKLIASDPAMVLAMAGLRPQQMDSIQKFMADVASFFRQGITLSPAFMVRNLIRGAVSTGILTGKNIGVQHNTFTGMARALRNTREAQAFKAQAGMADYRFGHQETGLGKNDVMIDLGLAPATAGYRIRKLISAAEGIGSATELADRIALRENLIRQGVRPDEASYQALNIINYGRKGANAQLQYMLPLIPFLNARIQGLARLAETPSGERNMRAAMLPIALRGSVLAAASALLWGWNNEDDEKRARYEAEPLHRRLNYHLVYAGDTKILIPKAFELGVLFGTIPELMLEATVQGDMEETGPALTQTLINTLSFNPMPAAVLPALEVAANYNFFTGRPLESLGDQSRMREDRIDYRTTAGSVELADTWLASMLDLSPIEVQHLLDGYGGIYANVLLSGLDTVAADMGLTPKRPEGAFGDLPVVSPIIDNVLGSMVKDADVDAADRYLGDFYDTKSAVSRIVLSARDARTIGDVERARELLAEFPTAPRAYKLVNSAGTKLSELNKEIKNIRRDLSMGAAAKANALRPLIARRKQLAYDVSKLLDELEDRQRRAFSDAQ